MVVVDQFYQIIEKQTSLISPLWKVAHISAFVVAAVCAFLTGFTFGRILDNFGHNCILDPEIVFYNSTFLNNSGNGTLRAIDLTYTIWGPQSECNFAQFTPLVVMISAVVWGTYFAVMSRGGAGYTTDLLSKPWAILYFFIIFSAILFITYVTSSKRLESGIEHFCDEFHPIFNNTGCVPEINMYMKQFQNRPKVLFYDFYYNMRTAIISSEIGIWAWVCQLVLCLLRICCAPDFELQLVTVMTKEEEQIENIVELSASQDLEEEV